MNRSTQTRRLKYTALALTLLSALGVTTASHATGWIDSAIAQVAGTSVTKQMTLSNTATIEVRNAVANPALSNDISGSTVEGGVVHVTGKFLLSQENPQTKSDLTCVSKLTLKSPNMSDASKTTIAYGYGVTDTNTSSTILSGANVSDVCVVGADFQLGAISFPLVNNEYGTYSLDLDAIAYTK